MRWQPTAMAAALLAAGLAQAAPPRATLTLLPTLGGSATWARDLNDAGQVVGSALDAGGAQTAFLWTAGQGLQALPFGGTASEALAINQAGQVAGWASISSRRQPIVWQAATGARRLTTPGDAGGVAAAINDRGDVAGHYAGPVVDLAARWSSAGTFTPLGQAASRATGIHNGLQVVGNLDANITAGLWQADGTLIELARSAQVNAIDDHGRAVGRSSVGGVHQATLWQADGSTVLLGPTHGAGGARDLNAAGQIVGLSTGSTATLWRAGAAPVSLNPLLGAGLQPTEVSAINGHAQIVGTGSVAGSTRAWLLTLHPDWTGGDGAWDDSTGTRWNWAGTGTAAARIGAVHDVVIDPGRSATVKGAAEGVARTLRLGGTAGTLVTLDLNGGTTRLGDGDPGIAWASRIGDGGTVRGSGRLEVRETLNLQRGGRIQVDGGQAMQLDVDLLSVDGQVRALGGPAGLARLELTGGDVYVNAGGAMQLDQADVLLARGAQNFGQLVLQRSHLGVGADRRLYNFGGATLAVGFGTSTVDGHVDNRGLLVVSQGAQASFLGRVDNTGELRVSEGGAASFFGLVVSPGAITGDGALRFEGGLTAGGPAVLQVRPDAWIGSEVALVLDGAQRIAFDGSVTLEGATLALSLAAAPVAGAVYDLFDWNGPLAGRFDHLALPTLAAGLAWDTADLYAGGTLSIAPVPEPGTWALWAAGLGLLLGRRTRR